MNSEATTSIETRDYSHLEGKIIYYYADNYIIETIVVGIDFHVGITLKATNKWTNNLNYLVSNISKINCRNLEIFCLNGELSPYGQSYYYVNYFTSMVKLIERGYFSRSEWYAIERTLTGFAPTSPHDLNCPYGA